MRAYLVQHGKANSADEDPNRGLSDEGRDEVTRIAEFLAALRISVSLIQHSGKARAEETAHLLADAIRTTAGPTHTDELNPDSDPLIAANFLKVYDDDIMIRRDLNKDGQVNKPGEFPIGRRIDVLQALSMAGGLTPFADSNDIRIMRREGDRQVVLPFEYNRVIRGDKLDQNVQLRAGDVVVVP